MNFFLKPFTSSSVALAFILFASFSMFSLGLSVAAENFSFFIAILN